MALDCRILAPLRARSTLHTANQLTLLLPGTYTTGGGWQEVAPDILICRNMSGMYPYMPRDTRVMCPEMYKQYPYVPCTGRRPCCYRVPYPLVPGTRYRYQVPLLLAAGGRRWPLISLFAPICPGCILICPGILELCALACTCNILICLAVPLPGSVRMSVPRT